MNTTNTAGNPTGTATITKEDLVTLLVRDVLNEYQHMLFYLNAGSFIQGLARVELGEWLAEEARDEMKHVEEFTKVIIELGGGDELQQALKNDLHLPLGSKDVLKTPRMVLEYVLAMEEEVVTNYTLRMDQAVELGGVDGRFVEIFLEEQILDSKSTAAHVRQILAGM